jgi:RHS repeat-associated protein
LFSNISSTDTAKPVGFTNDVNNKMVSKVHGNINISGNKRVGPSIILKVMTGDTISISTWGWYKGAVQPVATGVPALATELLPILTSGVGSLGGSKGGAIPNTVSDPLLSADITTMLNLDSSFYVSTRPKAFLNWMVVGEDFTAASSSPNHMGALQIPTVNTGDTAKQMVGPTNMVIRRNGWIYIYLSNESNQSVYFDNLVINLKHGPLLEVKNYYAFGTENPALNSQAIKQSYYQNRYKFNGIEFDTAFGFNDYEAKYRDYDAILGRFIQVDPKIESAEAWSVYSAMLNNPVKNIDPLGDSTIPGAGFWSNVWEGIKDGGIDTKNFVESLGTAEGWKNFGSGLMNMMSYEPNETNVAVANNIAAIPTMNKDQLGHMAGYGTEKVVEAVVISKGAGAVTKASEGAEAASTISPNVQKVVNTLNDIKADGGTVKINPLSPK